MPEMPGMPEIHAPGQWVTEGSGFEEIGMVQSFAVDKKLLHEKSQYQEIEVYHTANFGNLMVLDGVFQNTEADEFSYHEMIAHVPLFAHPSPKKVLIIGGGDGGAAREVAKHPGVEEIHQVEIDEMVSRVSKEFFPKISAALDHDPRIVCKFEDGSKFIQDPKWESYYDVVIVDSSDPIGPNTPLFREPFYRDIFKALKPNGIAVCQGESMWLHPKTIQSCLRVCRGIFPVVDYYYTLIPVYPCGSIGFMLLSKNAGSHPAAPHPDRLAAAKSVQTRYYSSEIHAASFIKPRFFYEEINC